MTLLKIMSLPSLLSPVMGCRDRFCSCLRLMLPSSTIAFLCCHPSSCHQSVKRDCLTSCHSFLMLFLTFLFSPSCASFHCLLLFYALPFKKIKNRLKSLLLQLKTKTHKNKEILTQKVKISLVYIY